MGFIYRLTFPSKKSYIGQTIRDIEKRFQAHQYPSSGCVAVCNAIQKYGWEKVEKDWYEVPDEDLNFYEEMLVALLGTLAPGGYNLMEGGGATGKRSKETKKKISESKKGEKHPMYGKKHAEETKQKMSEALSGEKCYMYGKKHAEETKQKMSEAKLGKEHAEDTKKKMSEAKSGEKNHFYGKKHTEETKQKMSESSSGEKCYMYGKTGEKHHASKRVYQYTLDGMYVDSFASSEEAAQALGKNDGTGISSCANPNCKRKTAYGFKWSYTEL